MSPSSGVLLPLFFVGRRQRLGLVAQVLLVPQTGKKLGIKKLRVTLTLTGEQYTLVQIRKSSDFAAGMEGGVAVLTQAQKVAAIMLATGPLDQMVDLQAAPHIHLRPPADCARHVTCRKLL
jgi:hypothetical protein